MASYGQMGTLSEADKVAETAVVPVRSKFADLSVEQRLEEAKLMSFEERDAYLRGRCKVARIEFAAAMSALDRATGLIEDNLPFFIVHFEDLDKRGHRSDLKGKPISKTVGITGPSGILEKDRQRHDNGRTEGEPDWKDDLHSNSEGTRLSRRVREGT